MKKVLVVDNHPVMLSFMSNLLEKEGHQVLTAADGLSALDILNTCVPDVIFVDLIMQNIDGKKLCQIIRRIPQLKDLFIVILSAIAAEQEIDLKELGANACVAKGPFNQMAKHILKALDLSDSKLDLEKEVLGLEGLFSREITKELLSVKRHFEAIIGSMSEGILEITSGGRIVYANPTALSLIGKEEEHLLGSESERIFAKDQRPEIRDLFKKVLSKSERVCDSSSVLLNGRDVLLKIFPVSDEGPNAIIILNDVSALRRSERALREERERLFAILDGNPIPIFVIDRDHNVTLWNRACEILTLVAKDQALGRQVDSGIFYTGKKRPVLADLVLEMDQGSINELYGDKDLKRNAHIPEAFEASDQLNIGGVQRHMYFLAARLRDAEGEVIGAIETLQDITDRRKLEEQLYQAQKMEAIGRLAGGVAHDFNNLLTSIKGYADLISTSLKGDDLLSANVEEIKKAGARAASLTRQLLAFSRRQILQPKVLDLNEVITDMGKMLARIIGEDVELVTVLRPGLGRVEADPGQIEQVIMNLAVNARDAMPKGGKLIIETANVDFDETSAREHGDDVQPGPYAMLAVSDTGIGMDEETRSKIFEPFFTTKEKTKGTGLGLSTIYGIVKQSGGHISVSSEPGQGSVFNIYLPEVRGDDKSPQEEHVSMDAFRGSETVLVVEDDYSVLKFVKTVLQGYGYRVLEAQDGEEALRLSDQHESQIHLLMTDVVMPGMSGRDLAERLQPRRPELRVLYMSGYPDEVIVHHGVLEPGVALLPKPFSPEELARKVREVLNAGEQENT